jgi:WD40 repeat protein
MCYLSSMDRARRWSVLQLALGVACLGLACGGSKPGLVRQPDASLVVADAEILPDAGVAQDVGIEANAQDAPASSDAVNAACPGRDGWGAGVLLLASAAGGRVVAAGYEDGSVTVWNADLSVRQQIQADTTRVQALALSDDGSTLVTMANGVDSKGSLRVFSVDDGALVWSLDGDNSIRDVLLSHDGHKLVLVGQNWRVMQAFDLPTGNLAWSIPTKLTRDESFVEFSLARGEKDLVFIGDVAVRVIDLATGDLLRERRLSEPPRIQGLLPSPSGDVIVAVDESSHLVVMQTSDFSSTMFARNGGDEIGYPSAFSADGSLLITEYLDVAGQVTRIPWRTGDWTPLPAWPASRNQSILASGVQGSQFVASDPAGRVSLVEGETGKNVGAATAGRGQLAEVSGLSFSPDGHFVASQSWRNRGDGSSLIVWSASTHAPLHTFLDVAHSSTGYAFSRDSKLVMFAGTDQTLRIHRLDDGTLVRKVGTNVLCVATAPDGKTVYACGSDRSIVRLRIDEDVPAEVVASLPFLPTTLAVATAGDLIAAASASGTELAVVHSAGGHVAWHRNEPGFDAFSVSVAFSPDGKLVAVKRINPSSGLVLLDARNGDQTAFFQTPGASVVGTIDFTSDGRLVALGVGSGVGIFRVTDGKLVYSVPVNLTEANSVASVAFSPVRDELLVGLLFGHIRTFCGLSALLGN